MSTMYKRVFGFARPAADVEEPAGVHRITVVRVRWHRPTLTGGGRSGRAWWSRILAVVVVTSVSGLTACGTSRPSSTTLPGSDASINGPEIDRLPTVPGPSGSLATPDLSTASGVQAFLREVFDDVQSMWATEFGQSGTPYRPARLVLFQSEVSTACGVESANIGPFYCSGDQTVYLDIRFFSTLNARFGVMRGITDAYIVGHELGHHVQFLLGVTQRVAATQHAFPAQTNALSVRVELQADCLSGVWAHSAYQRSLLGPSAIEAALHAAQVVGDDFLAHASGAAVDPDSWTHGSSAQRQQWFTTGYDVGRPGACDTFSRSL